MLRRCSRFVAVTSSAFLSLCASAPAQSTGAPGGKAPPKLVLFMVIDGFPQAREYQQTRRPLSAQPVHGPALAVIRYARIHGTRHRPWLTALLARRPTKIAAIALANKMARMVWAMMSKSERYGARRVCA